MPDTEQTVDLSPLDADYSIVGELGSTDVRRMLMAERRTKDSKRRDDHTGVIISVYNTPEGDEANALSHLAADTKLLAREGHRRLVPVVEGRWLGDQHFAVVTQRITDPTITQRLAGREVFSTVRIAAILRELNGLLEWAREQGVVHRIITGNGVYLEPRTDRVRVMFDVTPIHRVRPAEETRDGRTIARLAMTMLSGIEDPDACSVDNLHEMRPELPARLAEATAELLDVKNASTKTDIVNYIALIGMSDPLYRGEEEEKRIRAEILEEQRSEREKLANERAEFEAMMAKEKADFEAASTKERADFEAASTKERTDFAFYMDKERARLEAERLSLQKAVSDERAKLQKAMTQERAELTARRAELEKAVAAQKAELERVAALDRKKIEELRAELKRRGEAEIERKRQAALEEVEDASATELDEEELAAPLFVGPNLLPVEDITYSDENDVLATEPIVFEPERIEPAPEPERIVSEAGVNVERIEPETPTRNRWLIPGAIGGGVAVLGLIALAVTANHNATPAAPVRAPARPVAAVAQAPVPQAPAVPVSIVPLPTPGQVTDSAGGSIAPRSDSLAARRPAAVTEPAPRASTPVRSDTLKPRTTPRRPARSVSDSIFDFRSPTPARPRRDSASVSPVRRDSVVPPDTTKPI